jgi:hypothetical protein
VLLFGALPPPVLALLRSGYSTASQESQLRLIGFDLDVIDALAQV